MASVPSTALLANVAARHACQGPAQLDAISSIKCIVSDPDPCLLIAELQVPSHQPATGISLRLNFRAVPRVRHRKSAALPEA